MTIYVVMGTTGEYSDRTEWPVCWYGDEESAQVHVAEAEREGRRAFMEWQTQNPGRVCPRYGDKLVNPWDPDFRSDYTGTSYYYMKVPAWVGHDD